MKRTRPTPSRLVCTLTVVALAAGALVLLPTAAHAQQPPWPNGCSIGLDYYVQQGIDGLFLGACDRHDLCWGLCNGQNPPFFGNEHRRSCDATFFTEMAQACVVESALLTFPSGDFDTAQDFVENCLGVASVFYAAVSTPIGTGIFWGSQCLRGCNPDACGQVGAPLPPTCGFGVGPGFCYITLPLPDPDPCLFVDCELACGTPAGWLCCFNCEQPCEPAPPDFPPLDFSADDSADQDMSVDPNGSGPSSVVNGGCGCT